MVDETKINTNSNMDENLEEEMEDCISSSSGQQSDIIVDIDADFPHPLATITAKAIATLIKLTTCRCTI